MTRTRLLAACGASLFSFTSFCVSAHGAGFAIQEQGVSGLGNAFAGGAASAEDASTVYFNPAGMSLIDKPQLSAGLHAILPEASFTNQGSSTMGAPTQGGNATSDEGALVPNLYYVAPLNDDLVWGVGLSAPFGLTTEYDDDWVGRYVARKTELKTVLFNPSLAYRVSDKLSVGGGFSYLKGEAVLSNAIDMGLVFLSQFQAGGIPMNQQTMALAGDIQANFGTGKYDGGVSLEGDGEGWGFNLGLIYELSDATRLGAHYRSGISLDLSGQATFEVGPLQSLLGPAFMDQGGAVSLDLPDSASVSMYHELNDRWTLMGDVTRTWWSDFQTLTIEFENPSPPDSVIPELWEDVNKYSLGATYAFSDTLRGRFGVAYDESPVPNDEVRSPRIPDEDRMWLSLGLSIAASDSIDVHLAYTHIFVDDPVIDNSSHSAGQHLIGKIDAAVDLLSIGVNKRF
ncbi:OmpP1/FadL family transporter [Pelagicoccus sp. SDUM812003]|uniref:OmpP1/FadL family transporter n=1 Tax=Pelagicoccus sp. SDUM812003 TaxID=3041267 RepID=UPI00280D34FC|nr:OmpP1/FadL family transporter [Pelagicoccus sp. SDUM812003]MDQ8203914.1 OmpP1/FadL family transporter [Pelagicoccus sp. SDUM812003]